MMKRTEEQVILDTYHVVKDIRSSEGKKDVLFMTFGVSRYMLLWFEDHSLREGSSRAILNLCDSMSLCTKAEDTLSAINTLRDIWNEQLA